MTKINSEYRNDALNLLRGKYQNPIIVVLIFGVINYVLGFLYTKFAPQYDYTTFQVIDPGNTTATSIINIIQFLVSAGMLYSIFNMALKIIKGSNFEVGEVTFSGFKEDFLRNVVLNFLVSLFTALWAILFIIPGIIKAYAYSMSFYVVNKNSNLTASEAIDRSKTYTNGYKGKIFTLDLSYLLWYILGAFTLGILWLWIYPRHMVARTLLFEDIYKSFNPEPELEEVA
jgi:uncharacterized membrane protein